MGIAQMPDFVGVAVYTATDPTVIVHELGHNLGLDHAPCGTNTGLDPDYPHPNGHISGDRRGDRAIYGFNIYTRAIAPPDTKDLMSNCAPAWFSDWSYQRAMAALQSRLGPRAVRSAAILPAAEPVLIISGVISPTGGMGRIDSVVATETDMGIPQPKSGDYVLRLEDTNGQPLAAMPLGPWR